MDKKNDKWKTTEREGGGGGEREGLRKRERMRKSPVSYTGSPKDEKGNKERNVFNLIIKCWNRQRKKRF